MANNLLLDPRASYAGILEELAAKRETVQSDRHWKGGPSVRQAGEVLIQAFHNGLFHAHPAIAERIRRCLDNRPAKLRRRVGESVFIALQEMRTKPEPGSYARDAAFMRAMAGVIRSADKQPDEGSTCEQPESDNSARALEALLGDDTAEIMKIAHNGKSADDRMREICGIDRTYLHWQSSRWADLLGVNDGSIRQTPFWKKGRKEALALIGE